MINDFELSKIAHKYFNDNKDTAEIWYKKYGVNGESPADVWKEIAKLTSEMETPENQKFWESKFNELLNDWKFVPAGRILFGLREDVKNPNRRKITLSNCFVIPSPEDNLESIFETGKIMAKIYASGGGVGLDLSNIRPKGSKVNNSAIVSDGVKPFMELYSQITNTIAISGRRGALMLSIDVEKNPDVLEFINSKKDLGKVNYANISIKLSDAFMNAVINKSNWSIEFTVKDTGEKIIKDFNANDLFDIIVKNAHSSAEPGILFWDTIKNYSPNKYFTENEIVNVNPCLHPDTTVKIRQDGIEKVVIIKELSELDVSDIEIYSYDIENDKFDWDVIKKCWLTRSNAELIEIELDNGNILRLTPDHKVYTTNRGWVEAQFLTENDDLILDK